MFAGQTMAGAYRDTPLLDFQRSITMHGSGG
jgi:hypothetical protein